MALLIPSFLFVLLFGILLASFPARNLDIWRHLADGRRAAGEGAMSPTWLFDLVCYGLYSLGGGGTLAAVKALLCGLIAVLVLCLARIERGWQIALAATGLAVLAMGSRLLLQPVTLAVLFLAILLWILRREEERPTESIWPGWRLVVLFTVWANVAGWLAIGLGVLALTWLGRLFDGPRAGILGRALAQRLASFVIILAAACLSPSHIHALRIPGEVWAGASALRMGFADQAVNSPFDPAYLSDFRDSPAALAYYPLLILGLLSFLLNRRRWSWARFLPWFALAVVSGLQARAVPFFAVLAGPVLAWNLQELYARSASPVRRPVRVATLAISTLLAVAFLVCAWPGWLQRPPFGPRSWSVEQPAALVRGAEFLRSAHTRKLWGADTRTLHVGPDTLAAFAWFFPEDRAVRSETIIDQLLNAEDPGAARGELRVHGVTRVVVYPGDGRAAGGVLDRLLLDPAEWPVLHLKDGVAVFGWRDPAAVGSEALADWEVDFERLAFRPDETEMAPPARPHDERRWWHAFWKPAPPPRPAGRDEATILLRKAEAMTRSAPFRHLTAWESAQAASLIGSAGGWCSGTALLDLALRPTLFRPPLPDNAPFPPITQIVLALQQQFRADRGDAPVGIVYAAVRAARRAVAENPDDAGSHLVLGRAYVVLANTTSERSWAARNPQLLMVRQLQASAAFNRALALNPRLARAHLDLSRLYLARGYNCLDLAVEHLTAYRDSPPRWNGPDSDEELKAVTAEIERLTRTLERTRRDFTRESERTSVSERAAIALRRGLGGQARDILLKSDVAAFGAGGTELELDLLLRTGRPADVLEMMAAADEEVQGLLTPDSFLWLRCRALIALGDYDAADTGLAMLIGASGRLPDPDRVAKEVGGLVGKSVLEEFANSQYLPGAVFLVLSRSDFRTRIGEIGQKLSLVADVTVLRGLLALEAGNIPRAREAFREALAFAPSRWGQGQLDFSSRSVAWSCLALIEGRPAR